MCDHLFTCLYLASQLQKKKCKALRKVMQMDEKRLVSGVLLFLLCPTELQAIDWGGGGTGSLVDRALVSLRLSPSAKLQNTWLLMKSKRGGTNGPMRSQLPKLADKKMGKGV